MKILHFILPIFVAGGALTARGEWKLTEHEGQAIVVHEYNSESKDTPIIEGLEEILASRDEGLPLKHITFWTYFNNDPRVQGELLKEFRSQFPDILAEAFESPGNMHNPKVLSLRSKLSECLLKTSTLGEINEVLLAYGYSVKRIDFEKFWIDKESKATPFNAAIWLILEPEASGREAQAGGGNGGTAPDERISVPDIWRNRK